MQKGETGGLRNRLERLYLDERGFGSGRRFVSKLSEAVGAEGILLDIGCGEGMLRRELVPGARYVGLDRYIGKRAGEYEGWDMSPNVVGDAHRLPFKDGSFTAVAMMHVLEHVGEPDVVFGEVGRLLVPGGYLFIDVPFLHQLHHQPNDHFRYTPFALRRLAESVKLEVVEILPSGGYFRFIAYALRQSPSAVSARGVLAGLARAFVAWPLAAIGVTIEKLQYLMDIFDVKQEMVCGYHVVMRKPTDE